MPKYRMLHVKIRESLDVDAMSSDFVRLTWTWLPLVADKDGRGLLHPGWLKSNVYPLRSDISDQMMMDAMQEFINLGLVVLYTVGNREYWEIVKWHDHQKTSKEGTSHIPPPYSGVSPELVRSKSRPTQTNMVSGHSIYISSSLSEGGSMRGETNGELQQGGDMMTAICNVSRAGLTDPKTYEIARDLLERGITPEQVRGFETWWRQYKDEKPYPQNIITFWDDYTNNRPPFFARKNDKDRIEELLALIADSQRKGLEWSAFEAELKARDLLQQWQLLSMKWADVKRLTEQQTLALRFRLQGVAQ